VVSRSRRALLGALLSCVLCLLIGMPALATTVAPPPSDEWLDVEPAALEQAAIEEAAFASASTPAQTVNLHRNARAQPAIVPTLPLVDQVGAVSSSALRANAVAPRSRSLAGGPGAGGKGSSVRRQQHVNRTNLQQRVKREREAKARAAAARRADRQRQSKIGRKHGHGPVNKLTVDLGVLFTTQFDGSRYANSNCTMAAAAMLFEVQTGRPVSGAQMRRWSNSRRRGTGLIEIERAFRRGHQPVQTYEDLPWQKFVRAVADGRSAVVMGWYGYLPQRYVLQKGFRTAHSVFVLGYSSHVFDGRGGFFVMDPLGRSGYAGQWWTRKALWRFGWKGKAGVRGSGPRAFRGSVAFQMNRSVKHLGKSPTMPRFRSYWATTKELMRRSERVSVLARNERRLGPRFGNTVLRVHDPQLRMEPRKAARYNQLRWPLARAGTVVAGYSRQHRSITIRTGAGAKVLAAAAGRVVFRSWSRETKGAVWIMHGKKLFTIYTDLARVRVQPGQWVNRGSVLGYVAKEKKRQKSARWRFAVVNSGRPFELWGRSNPRFFLRSMRPG
jgi:hypothetical protein